jgi:hypothetical protein
MLNLPSPCMHLSFVLTLSLIYTLQGDGIPSDADFIEAVRQHGRDFKAICWQLGMRGTNACKHFYYKNRTRLGLDAVVGDREHGGGGGGGSSWEAPSLAVGSISGIKRPAAVVAGEHDETGMMAEEEEEEFPVHR